MNDVASKVVAAVPFRPAQIVGAVTPEAGLAGREPDPDLRRGGGTMGFPHPVSPRVDSNHDWSGSEPDASAGWATRG